jgi:hypothetical protein
VNVLKLKVAIIAFFLFTFIGGGMAFANGEHKTNSNTETQSTMKGMDMSGKDKDMDMSTMDMDGKDKNMDMSGSNSNDDMEGMNMEDGHSHEPVKEVPPNAKVLGTYGAVNLAFIIIGVWNKVFRRKDVSNVNSK